MRLDWLITYPSGVGLRYEWGCMSQRSGIDSSVNIEFGSTAFMSSTFTCNRHPLGLERDQDTRWTMTIILLWLYTTQNQWLWGQNRDSLEDWFILLVIRLDVEQIHDLLLHHATRNSNTYELRSNDRFSMVYSAKISVGIYESNDRGIDSSVDIEYGSTAFMSSTFT
jgi:hypothetical protein